MAQLTTADWALVISLFSLVIASASFVWNVWSKFIYPKPKLVVSLMVMRVLEQEPARRHLHLDVTNFGPGDVIVSCAVAMPKKPWYRRRIGLGILNPINDLSRPEAPTGPFAGGLPKKLAPGEGFSLIFPFAAEMFLREPLQAIGVHDSFRHAHWAPRRDLDKVLEKHRTEFRLT